VSTVTSVTRCARGSGSQQVAKRHYGIAGMASPSQLECSSAGHSAAERIPEREARGIRLEAAQPAAQARLGNSSQHRPAGGACARKEYHGTHARWLRSKTKRSRA
jgi:hypothetical protein